MQTNNFDEQCPRTGGRRAATRNRFYGEIELDWGSKIVTGIVRDLSREGMFIEMDEWPAIGRHFAARLNLGTPLPIQCVVQRIAICQGIGVTFTLVDDKDSRQRLNALLRLLRRSRRRTAVVSSVPHMPELHCFALANQ